MNNFLFVQVLVGISFNFALAIPCNQLVERTKDRHSVAPSKSTNLSEVARVEKERAMNPYYEHVLAFDLHDPKFDRTKPETWKVTSSLLFDGEGKGFISSFPRLSPDQPEILEAAGNRMVLPWRLHIVFVKDSAEAEAHALLQKPDPTMRTAYLLTGEDTQKIHQEITSIELTETERLKTEKIRTTPEQWTARQKYFWNKMFTSPDNSKNKVSLGFVTKDGEWRYLSAHDVRTLHADFATFGTYSPRGIVERGIYVRGWSRPPHFGAVDFHRFYYNRQNKKVVIQIGKNWEAIGFTNKRLRYLTKQTYAKVGTDDRNALARKIAQTWLSAIEMNGLDYFLSRLKEYESFDEKSKNNQSLLDFVAELATAKKGPTSAVAMPSPSSQQLQKQVELSATLEKLLLDDLNNSEIDSAKNRRDGIVKFAKSFGEREYVTKAGKRITKIQVRFNHDLRAAVELCLKTQRRGQNVDASAKRLGPDIVEQVLLRQKKSNTVFSAEVLDQDGELIASNFGYVKEGTIEGDSTGYVEIYKVNSQTGEQIEVGIDLVKYIKGFLNQIMYTAGTTFQNSVQVTNFTNSVGGQYHSIEDIIAWNVQMRLHNPRELDEYPFPAGLLSVSDLEAMEKGTYQWPVIKKPRALQ